MSKLKAAEDIRLMASRFKAVLEVADILDGIGSIEQAEQEAKNRLEVAIKDEAKQAEKIERARAELKDAQVAVDLIKDFGKKREEEALLKASKIIEAAREEASLLLSDAKVKVVSLEDEKASLVKDLGGVKLEIESEKAVLAGIKKEIAEVKSRFAKLIP